jgi:hypothetical protein
MTRQLQLLIIAIDAIVMMGLATYLMSVRIFFPAMIVLVAGIVEVIAIVVVTNRILAKQGEKS